MLKSCSIEGCNRKIHAKGYCMKHYTRNLKYGDPLFTKLPRHNKRYTSEYSTYISMKNRCYYEDANNYHCYGARGIKVCDRWLDSFSNFYEDMGPRPFKKAEIDRIDNDGNYGPLNCRWVTHKQNARNRSNKKLNERDIVVIKSKYKTGAFFYKDLASIYCVSASLIGKIVRGEKWQGV